MNKCHLSIIPNYLFYTVKLYVAWLTNNERHVVYLYVQTLHYLYITDLQ